MTPTVSVGNKASNTRSGKNPAPTKRCWPDSSAEQADAQASTYSFCSSGSLTPTETHKDKPQGRRQYQQFGTATAVSTSLTVWAKRQGRGKIPGPKNGKGHPFHKKIKKRHSRRSASNYQKPSNPSSSSSRSTPSPTSS